MATDLTLRENTEIQGDIIAGFKKDHTCLLFIQFEDVARARTWLEKLAPNIATNKQVAHFNKEFSKARRGSGGDDPRTLKATWLAISFTCPGIQFLTGRKNPIPKVPTNSTLEAFVQGAAERATELGDIDDSAPGKWLFGYDTGRTIHAVLTIASDTAADLQGTLAAQRDAITRASAVVVFQQDAAHFQGDRKGKEHFGFKDGVSEPGVAGFDEADPDREGYVRDHPGTRLIPAGEFVIGHPRIDHGGKRNFPGEHIPPWMENGTFQVVKRLGQDVPGWWAQVGRALEVLQNTKGAVPDHASVEWLAARFVGRWRSGAPVHKYPVSDPAQDPSAVRDNDVSFKDDPDGLKTPLFSHLRQTAPRDGLVDEELVEEKFMDARRIIRRGSPYGEPFDPLSGGARGPDAPRGLLFISYQADLVDQFEFIQKDWCNTSDFPPRRSCMPGPDAMISGKLAHNEPHKGIIHYESRSEAGASVTTPIQLQRFVRTEGAVYTFVPSISTLKLLAQGRVTEHVSRVEAVDEILPVPDLQRFNGISQYWLFDRSGYRPIAIPDDGETTDRVQRPAGAIAAWPALRDVTKVDAILPIPDLQRNGGKSHYWVFHTVRNKQVYRIISITGGTHTSALEVADRNLDMWTSLAGVSQVDAFLPMPDLQRSQGRSHYWVFHTSEGKQVYRVISIADGPEHADTEERDDRELNLWKSLIDITKVDAFLPVPAMQRAAGKSHFWVFHGNRVRTISIADGRRHTDTPAQEDRPLGEWVTLS
jgi:Dyp-type peroxidase family